MEKIHHNAKNQHAKIYIMMGTQSHKQSSQTTKALLAHCSYSLPKNRGEKLYDVVGEKINTIHAF